MMIHPSYKEMIDAVNQEREDDTDDQNRDLHGAGGHEPVTMHRVEHSAEQR